MESYNGILTPYLAYLVGAKETEVAAANTLTVNLHLLFISFFRPTSKRYKILMEPKPFPSDLYLVQSQLRFHGFDPKEGILFPPHDAHGRTNLADFLKTLHKHGDEIALVFISPMNYYNGNYLSIELIAEATRKLEIPLGLDLAHTIANIPLNLHEWRVEFGAWRSYKYLNGELGAIGGYFVHGKHHKREDLVQFAGWWGHNKATRFLMPPEFHPVPTAERWQLSNPPIPSLAPLLASLSLFQTATIERLRQISLEMTDYLFKELSSLLEVEVVTFPEPELHGCQLSLVISRGKELFRSLLEAGIILDWREPAVIRIASTPLYNTKKEIDQFLYHLKKKLQ